MKLVDEKDLANLIRRDCKLNALEYAGIEHRKDYNNAIDSVQEVLAQSDKELIKHYIDA